MCRRRGIQNAVEKVSELEVISWNGDDVIKRRLFLNDVRNNLKHANDDADDEFEVTELDPFFMIVRALANAKLLGVAFSVEMENFCVHHNSNNQLR